MERVGKDFLAFCCIILITTTQANYKTSPQLNRIATATPANQRKTTTHQPPAECESSSTVSLNEPIRISHVRNGSYNTNHLDDKKRLLVKRPWFRFTGEAGTRLMSSCPPMFACGTWAPLWSEDAHPRYVGESAVLNVYGKWDDWCEYLGVRLEVKCCSQSPPSFIYRLVETSKDYINSLNYNVAFCGMN